MLSESFFRAWDKRSLQAWTVFLVSLATGNRKGLCYELGLSTSFLKEPWMGLSLQTTCVSGLRPFFVASMRLKKKKCIFIFTCQAFVFSVNTSKEKAFEFFAVWRVAFLRQKKKSRKQPWCNPMAIWLVVKVEQTTEIPLEKPEWHWWQKQS